MDAAIADGLAASRRVFHITDGHNSGLGFVVIKIVAVGLCELILIFVFYT